MSSTVYVYRDPHDGGTNPKFADAFARGCGAPVIDDAVYRGGSWAGFGSPVTWSSLTDARFDGADWYYGDHGYFHRGTHYRITRNAYQHDGRGDQGRDPGVTIEPWRKDGGFVLVCPPDDKIARLMGFDEVAWLDDVLLRITWNTDRQVKVRPRNTADTPLAADLANAWALVTWASNAAVEAVLAGVPVFCTGDCAASVMGRSDPIGIEYPVYPDDRHEWASALAANQWTLDEISSGIAWRTLSEEV